MMVEAKRGLFLFEDFWPFFKLSQMLGFFHFKKVKREETEEYELKPMSKFLSLLRVFISLLLTNVPHIIFIMYQNIPISEYYKILEKHVIHSMTSKVYLYGIMQPSSLLSGIFIIWNIYCLKIDTTFYQLEDIKCCGAKKLKIFLIFVIFMLILTISLQNSFMLMQICIGKNLVDYLVCTLFTIFNSCSAFVMIAPFLAVLSFYLQLCCKLLAFAKNCRNEPCFYKTSQLMEMVSKLNKVERLNRGGRISLSQNLG